MAWELVPPLKEGREQFDKRFPKRKKTLDGSIGNLAHAVRPSSHNPDKTGKPEHADGDSKDEVRAIDVDKELQDDGGVTMEDVVQFLVKMCRLGYFPWIRYIIFNKRIWHRRDNFTSRAYTGSNDHSKHAHINSEFNQTSDSTTGTNWRLGEIKKPAPATPKPKPSLVVDGDLGPKTISKWQQVMKTPVDGKIDKDRSELIVAVQRKLKSLVDRNLVVDGDLGPKTIGVMQRYLKVPVNRRLDSVTVKALQRRLNENRF